LEKQNSLEDDREQL